jgi:hypothetical protein
MTGFRARQALAASLVAPALATLVLTVLALAIPALTCLGAAAKAQTAPPVTLSASLTPNRLGGRTTIGFQLTVGDVEGLVPPPLVGLAVSYPMEIGLGLSELGLDECSAATLEASGPVDCPQNSVMGYGKALSAIAFGPNRVVENTPITIFRGPNEGEHTALLFYATGPSPVKAHLVAQGLLLPTEGPFGGRVTIALPLVPSLPEAQYLSIVKLSATIGPKGVSYVEEAEGRAYTYVPKGFLMPDTCPRGGFQFGATLTFEDGKTASAHTLVGCHADRRRRKRAGEHPTRQRRGQPARSSGSAGQARFGWAV